MKRKILAILSIMTFTNFLYSAQIKTKKKSRECKIVLRRAELKTITLYNFEQISVDPVWLRESPIAHFFCTGCKKEIYWSYDCHKNRSFYRQLHEKQCAILYPQPAKKGALLSLIQIKNQNGITNILLTAGELERKSCDEKS